VKATLSGNYWMAQNVPLPGGSTPTVQARAIPNSNNGGGDVGVENDFVKWNDISSVWNLSIIDYLEPLRNGALTV
jgi:hypothetical protein